jgi:hypothetical protein
MAQEPTEPAPEARQEDADRDPGNGREIHAPSGWVTTQQAARSLGISPRTVRWHIEQGNLEAKPEGEGVRRTWLVSIDSLHSFRDARQAAGDMPRTNRVIGEGADIAPDTLGNPIRELADRLAEEAAKAAEYRVRLELTEQAQSTLEAQLEEERTRRTEAERERDELREQIDALSEPRESPLSAFDVEVGGEAPEPTTGEPRAQRSWWRRMLGG